MTEQPPPSADSALDELLPPLDGKWDYKGDDPAWRLLYRWHKKYADNQDSVSRGAIGRLFLSSGNSGLHTLGKAINALIAQRVSDETERIAKMCDGLSEDALQRARIHSSPTDIAQWKQAADDFALVATLIRAPAERPAPPQQKDCWRWPDCGCTDDNHHVCVSVPSALASTGEQPDKEEDLGKGSV